MFLGPLNGPSREEPRSGASARADTSLGQIGIGTSDGMSRGAAGRRRSGCHTKQRSSNPGRGTA